MFKLAANDSKILSAPVHGKYLVDSVIFFEREELIGKRRHTVRRYIDLQLSRNTQFDVADRRTLYTRASVEGNLEWPEEPFVYDKRITVEELRQSIARIVGYPVPDYMNPPHMLNRCLEEYVNQWSSKLLEQMNTTLKDFTAQSREQMGQLTVEETAFVMDLVKFQGDKKKLQQSFQAFGLPVKEATEADHVTGRWSFNLEKLLRERRKLLQQDETAESNHSE